jgi:hypothetical protein
MPSISSVLAGSGPIIYELYVLGDWLADVLTKKLVFTALLALQIVLTAIAVILVREWKFEKQATNETAQSHVA